MSCRRSRAQLSAYVEGDLTHAQVSALLAHVRACGVCRDRLAGLRAACDAVAELPRLSATESIAGRVLDRLEVESRGPGLALVFRSFLAARPLIVPSLATAATLLLLMVSATLGVDRLRVSLASGLVKVVGQDWPAVVAPSGTEANPLFPSAEVSLPRPQDDAFVSDGLLEQTEGTLFLETVVARDGSVSMVTLLGGDRDQAQPLLDALRQQRFEPGTYRGRPVAVSVYRLISRMDVRSTT